MNDGMSNRKLKLQYSEERANEYAKITAALVKTVEQDKNPQRYLQICIMHAARLRLLRRNFPHAWFKPTPERDALTKQLKQLDNLWKGGIRKESKQATYDITEVKRVRSTNPAHMPGEAVIRHLPPEEEKRVLQELQTRVRPTQDSTYINYGFGSGYQQPTLQPIGSPYSPVAMDTVTRFHELHGTAPALYHPPTYTATQSAQLPIYNSPAATHLPAQFIPQPTQMYSAQADQFIENNRSYNTVPTYPPVQLYSHVANPELPGQVPGNYLSTQIQPAPVAAHYPVIPQVLPSPMHTVLPTQAYLPSGAPYIPENVAQLHSNQTTINLPSVVVTGPQTNVAQSASAPRTPYPAANPTQLSSNPYPIRNIDPSNSQTRVRVM